MAQMCNCLYSKGKGSPGDAQTGNPNWASKGEKLLKLCLEERKVWELPRPLGITQTIVPAKPTLNLLMRVGLGGWEGW